MEWIRSGFLKATGCATVSILAAGETGRAMGQALGVGAEGLDGFNRYAE